MIVLDSVTAETLLVSDDSHVVIEIVPRTLQATSVTLSVLIHQREWSTKVSAAVDTQGPLRRLEKEPSAAILSSLVLSGLCTTQNSL